MIKIFKNFTEAGYIREAWNKLAETRQLFLLTYDWFYCCAVAFHKADKIFVVCVFEDNNLIAVAPMYRSIKNDQKHLLQIIGSRRLYEPSGLLYKDTDALNTLLNACKATGYPLFLSRCYDAATLHASIQSDLKPGITFNIPSIESQYINLTEDFSSFETGLSSRRRYDIRRALRRAQQMGECSFKIDRICPDDLATSLNQAFEVENASWKSDNRSSVALNSDLSEFFSCLFETISADQKAVVGFMHIDQRPVASVLAVVHENGMYILKIGYHRDYSKCSPGILLMHQMIDFAYSLRLSKFEFLGSRENWVNLWKPELRRYSSFLFYPLSYRGLKGFIIDISYRLRRKLLNRA